MRWALVERFDESLEFGMVGEGEHIPEDDCRLLLGFSEILRRCQAVSTPPVWGYGRSSSHSMSSDCSVAR
jgi:hypothetical protein